MVTESGMRPWADLHPELLNLIYDNLRPSSAAAARSSGFGSVCKPWHQFHAAVPLPPPCHHRHLLISPTIDEAVPDAIRDELRAASIAYSWQSSGWLLLRHSHDGQIFSCFNPLFPWPENYIKLPTGRDAITPLPVEDPDSPSPINAAFSSDPAGPDDWTVLNHL